MSISIEISPSINKAITYIDKYSKNLSKCDEFCKRIADIGGNVAEIAFSRIASAYNFGTDEYAIFVEPYQDGYEISAYGESVAFIEFGTGVVAGGTYPQGDVNITPPVPTQARSWSLGAYGSRQLENKDFWVFEKDGEKYFTRGNPPAKGMYYASKEMRDMSNILQIAREVFIP